MLLKRKIVAAIILTLLLVGMLTLAFNVQSVKASGTVYIRADGSIDPPTAPISTVDNVTYTFTGDINDSIVIERDTIIVDGAGYTLQGTYANESIGAHVTGRSNVTIKNTNIKNFTTGIRLDSCSGNEISGNNLTANHWYGIYLNSCSGNDIYGNYITANNVTGIRLYSSSGNDISGNNIMANDLEGISLYSSSSNSFSGNNITANNRYGIFLSDSSSYNNISGNKFISNGLYVDGSYQNSVENNTVNGKLLVYLEGVSNYTVDDAGQVILVRCGNIRVEGLNLSRSTVGVELWETSNSTISENNITENGWAGIDLEHSSNYNIISGNNITANNFPGILLYYSSSNSISGNRITANNFDGILLYTFSSNNSITGNNITANHDYGIEFAYSSNYNSIFHNNFINNALQVSSINSVNFWDNGYPSGGNYWSDYSSTDTFKGPYQNETGIDGIGDTPYGIDESNIDHYPLMHLWVRLPGDINGDGIVDIYDAILLANAYNSTPGIANWNPNADVNGDSIVDIYDAIILASHYNQHYP
jgi:parallel beta-helix repeat protein